MPDTREMTAERLGQIVEGAAAEIYIFGHDDLRFLLVNKGARDNLGYSKKELARLHPWDLKPEYTKKQFIEFVRPLLDGREEHLQFETVHERKDGSTYDASVRLQLISSDDLPVFYAAIQDITEQNQVRKELQEVSGRLDAILNNTTMAVFMMDERQHCSFMNKAAEELTGYTFEETRGKPLHDVVHHTYPDGRPFPIEECPIDRAFPENHKTQGEEVFVHKDGSFYHVGFTASPVIDSDGTPVGTVIEAHNIEEELQAREALTSFNAALRDRVDEAMTEREELEVQLVQAQKMEALGQLTGGVAHDFNNLLQVIGGNLELLKQDPIIDGRNTARINNAISGVERGAKLASQLLAFGRQQPLNPKPINAGRVLRGMGDMLRRTLGETVQIETIVSAGLWNCLADPRLLENVLLNLAINARDAMNGRGKLTLEAGNASLDEEYVAANPDASVGKYVMIAVTDTGRGIPEESLSKVFEPFFTTKAPGEGTGLGLSMVFGFVKQSGGHIAIYSEEGEGTTVRIYLPRTHKEEMSKRPASGLVTAQGNDEVILVVEDDEDVRATVVEQLGNLGYRVIEASSADSALAIIQCGISIDLLFTDVVMPGKLRSPELARMAKERMPNLAVLFTSGYTKNAIVHGGKLDDDIELISKPYSTEQLSQKIRATLDMAGEPEAGDTTEAVKYRQNGNGKGTDGDRIGRALVVEDEPLIRMTLIRPLERAGYEVLEADSLKTARERIKRTQVDVVVSDFGLPDGKATQFLQEVLQKNPDVDIVLATGGNVPEELEQMPVSILRKPFSGDALKKALGL
ncbi:PAS domain S-box protein [Qipengyuania sp.]|uniref:PAS domain S-box protein n=1 Tax=Qipengyuania sp. TaxID=2004515 RepID=UPI003BAA6A81